MERLGLEGGGSGVGGGGLDGGGFRSGTYRTDGTHRTDVFGALGGGGRGALRVVGAWVRLGLIWLDLVGFTLGS
jgi:hypothetical protein